MIIMPHSWPSHRCSFTGQAGLAWHPTGLLLTANAFASATAAAASAASWSLQGLAPGRDARVPEPAVVDRFGGGLRRVLLWIHATECCTSKACIKAIRRQGVPMHGLVAQRQQPLP